MHVLGWCQAAAFKNFCFRGQANCVGVEDGEIAFMGSQVLSSGGASLLRSLTVNAGSSVCTGTSQAAWATGRAVYTLLPPSQPRHLHWQELLLIRGTTCRDLVPWSLAVACAFLLYLLVGDQESQVNCEWSKLGGIRMIFPRAIACFSAVLGSESRTARRLCSVS